MAGLRRGFADLHTHQFAYLGFGGKAFWGRAFEPIDKALKDCAWAHGPRHVRDFVTAALKVVGFGKGGILESNAGYPQFDGWPTWDGLAHQTMHQDWLYRALQGGLRLMVVHAVNSEHMCETPVNKMPGRTCNDMEAVNLQLDEARSMEDYIRKNAQLPWYCIVTSPHEARAVIDAGRLAVVLGVEVDFLFNCHKEGDLTPQALDAELRRYARKGLRHVFPIHFSNNGFGGTAYQNKLTYAERVEVDGVGQDVPPWFRETGSAYPITVEPNSASGYEFAPMGLGPARNVLGLTELGKRLIRGLIARGMLIDVDHASQKAKSDLLDIADEFDCPVVSSHTGFVSLCKGEKRHEGQLTDKEIGRIKAVDGLIAPITWQGEFDQVVTHTRNDQPVVSHGTGGSTETFAQAYLYAVDKMGGSPVPLGTDLNGFMIQPGPRLRFHDFGPPLGVIGLHSGGTGSKKPPLTYPFKATAGEASLGFPTSPHRNFNTHGLSHVGLLPDLVADLEQIGVSKADLEPLYRSAEGYVVMWEKAWAKRQGLLLRLALKASGPPVWSVVSAALVASEPCPIATDVGVAVYALSPWGALLEFLQQPAGNWGTRNISSIVNAPPLMGSPCALVGDAAARHVFARGRDGKLFEFANAGDASWQMRDVSAAVGGQLVSGDADALFERATAEAMGRLFVFAPGPKGELLTFHRGGKVGWKLLHRPVKETFAGRPNVELQPYTTPAITGRPSAVATGYGDIYVFARGDDFGELQMYHLHASGQQQEPPGRPGRPDPRDRERLPLVGSATIRQNAWWELFNISNHLGPGYATLISHPSAAIDRGTLHVVGNFLDTGLAGAAKPAKAGVAQWRKVTGKGTSARLIQDAPCVCARDSIVYSFAEGYDGRLAEYSKASKAIRFNPAPFPPALATRMIAGRPAAIFDGGTLSVFVRTGA